MANKTHNSPLIPNVLLLSPNAQPALLKQRELARVLGVSSRTLDNWKRRKTIPAIKISTRCVRFELASVLAALRRYEVREVGR
jgi:predicted DNA-binding transcriptional regulator AlpA